MKKMFILSLLALWFVSCATNVSEDVKPKWMWFDCSANWERMSYPDSIKYYLDKCEKVGMTAIVLDIKGTSSEVVYSSAVAPQKKEWKGFTRPDFDFVGTFIKEARERGLKIYGSFNVFAEGHGIFKRGLIYNEHPEWQSLNYVPGKGMLKQLEIENKSVIFTNPLIPEVQNHEIAIFKEFVTKYDVDGIVLDRGRFDNIQSDFSDFSRKEFEKYIGEELVRFPEDVYEWVANEEGGYDMVKGQWFEKWIEWRAKVIYDFFKLAKEEVKSIKPELEFGAYTGAWYPSYFEVGVNWASKNYDPSTEYSWASPQYKNYGYAELLDVYTNGNYYWNVTIEEYNKSNGLVMNETDSKASKGNHLCVEGGCRYSKKLLDNKPFLGGMYVEDYKKDTTQFKRAVKMNLKESDGLMVFDIVHIINRNWWGPLECAIEESGE